MKSKPAFYYNVLIAKKEIEESPFTNSVYRHSDYVEGYGKNSSSEAGNEEILKLLRDFLTLDNKSDKYLVHPVMTLSSDRPYSTIFGWTRCDMYVS